MIHWSLFFTSDWLEARHSPAVSAGRLRLISLSPAVDCATVREVNIIKRASSARR
jgi:hypothetical protein